MTKKEKVHPFPMSMYPSDIEAIKEWIIKNGEPMPLSKAIRILIKIGIKASKGDY